MCRLSSAQSSLFFRSCVSAHPFSFLSVRVYRWVVAQSTRPGLGLGFPPSAGSVLIEKAELKMNSLNLGRGPLQSCNRANGDPATRASIIYPIWNPTWKIISPLLEIGFVSCSRGIANCYVHLFCSISDSLLRLCTLEKKQTNKTEYSPYAFMTVFSQNSSTKHASEKQTPYLVFLRWSQLTLWHPITPCAPQGISSEKGQAFWKPIDTIDGSLISVATMLIFMLWVDAVCSALWFWPKRIKLRWSILQYYGTQCFVVLGQSGIRMYSKSN